MASNLYRTRNEGEYFHLHGSLDPTKTLNMIGLDGWRGDLNDYEDIIELIEHHVRKYTAEELEGLNHDRRQAGVTAYRYEEFINCPHVSSPVAEKCLAPDMACVGLNQYAAALVGSLSLRGRSTPNSTPFK